MPIEVTTPKHTYHVLMELIDTTIHVSIKREDFNNTDDWLTFRNHNKQLEAFEKIESILTDAFEPKMSDIDVLNTISVLQEKRKAYIFNNEFVNEVY